MTHPDDHTLEWLVELLRYRLAEMGKRDKTLTIKFCKAGAKKLVENLESEHNRLQRLEASLKEAIEYIAYLQAGGCEAGPVAVPSNIKDGLLAHVWRPENERSAP